MSVELHKFNSTFKTKQNSFNCTLTPNRYVENNVRISSQYRQYNVEVPLYLHDRPPSLINHCLDRLSSAVEIEQECIQVTDEERGTFKVKSLDPNNQGCWYCLSFGDDETMPHCECLDWEKHRLPCKHFLAVFKYCKGWGFDKFPKHYRESPFLTLDHFVVFRKEPIANIEEGEAAKDAIPENKVHCTNKISDKEPSKLPDRQKSRRTWNTKCKEALKHVTSLTHIVDNTESLKEVYTLLKDCINILSNAAQKEEGLVLEKPLNKGTSKSSTPKSSPSESSTFKSSTSKSKSSSSFKEIPIAKSRNPFSGRHGERAEVMKRTFKVNVDVTAGQPVPKRAKKSLSDCVTETEIVYMDLDYPSEPVTSDPNPKSPSTTHPRVMETEFTRCTKPDVKPGAQADPKPHNQSTEELDTHCTEVPPATCNTVPPATTTTAVPSLTPTAVPAATNPTAVPPATRTAVPPAAPTDVPPAAPTDVPPAAPNTVPPAAPTAVPPAAPTTVFFYLIVSDFKLIDE